MKHRLQKLHETISYYRMAKDLDMTYSQVFNYAKGKVKPGKMATRLLDQYLEDHLEKPR